MSKTMVFLSEKIKQKLLGVPIGIAGSTVLGLHWCASL
jgi:hypothetical protein